MSHSHPFATKYFNANPCEWDFIFCLRFATLKPQSVLRPHLLSFAIAGMLPYCFCPLADICTAITSRRSPLRLR